LLFLNSIKFPNIFNVYNGNTDTEKEFTSINRCIALILTTAKRELFMEPDFGCTLYEQLFSPAIEDLLDQVKTDIVTTITKYEKRVETSVDRITIEKVSDTPTTYHINIAYNIKNSELTNEAVLTVKEDEY
jgi:phage baseplate assembly protein W